MSIGAPIIYVDVYPPDGGKYTISPDSHNALQISVDKPLMGGGSFALTLTPGGPEGPNKGLSWGQILTPQSLVVLRGRRGDESAGLMVGLIKKPEEKEEWGDTVARQVNIEGRDFTYFFDTFSFYSLNALGFLQNLYFGGTAESILSGDTGLLVGSPEDVGRTWYEKIMVGERGFLSQTSFSMGSSSTKFKDLVSTVWEPYAYTGKDNVSIPMSLNFVNEEGTWLEKFNKIFPHPVYEFFVGNYSSVEFIVQYIRNTAVPRSAGTVNVVSAPGLTLGTLGVDDVGPVLVARNSPLPFVDISGNLRQDLWKALPLYDLTSKPYRYRSKTLYLSAEGHGNYYVWQPVNAQLMSGGGNGNILNWIVTAGGGIDPTAMTRYGYSPVVKETMWWVDTRGLSSQKTAQKNAYASIQDLIANTGLQMGSFYGPIPLLYRGSVIIPFSPTIQPGTRFRFAPFRDGRPYDFYIDRVQHNYSIAQATTALSLSRGLPKAVYDDPVMLTAVLQHRARIIDGKYVEFFAKGSGAGISWVGPEKGSTSLELILKNLPKAFSLPGYKGG